MKKSKNGFGSDFAKVDAHVIQPQEYDDAPEWTDEMFEKANLYIGGKLVRRGRPIKETPKISTTLRLDADLLKALRAKGKGWQSRVNEVLREWVAQNPG